MIVVPVLVIILVRDFGIRILFLLKFGYIYMHVIPGIIFEIAKYGVSQGQQERIIHLEFQFDQQVNNYFKRQFV